MTLTLKELAAAIGAELVGEGGTTVSSAATLEQAGPGQISFLSNPKYARQLDTTRASAVVVAQSARSAANPAVALLKTRDPYYSFTQAVIQLHGHRKHPHDGIHPAAHVDPTASVGEGTIIYPGVYVAPRVKIGRDCILYSNVVIYDDCVVGDRVIVHAGSSIGHDGFGYATHKDDDGVVRHHKIPQIGNAVLEDDVEIGANCSISRAALGSTIIARGTKLDGLVAIGHGARLGEHCLIVSQVGIAGSVTVGNYVTMAGQVGVAGHLKIGDRVTIGAQAGIISDVEAQQTILGAPGMPAARARRVYHLFTQLPELLERIKKLEGQVDESSVSEENEGDVNGGDVSPGGATR